MLVENEDIEIESISKEVDEVDCLEDNDEHSNDRVNDEENLAEEPEVGMMFDHVDDMYTFYKKYGKYKGFPVKRRSSKKDDDGVVKYVTFCCSRSGTSRSNSSNILKPRPTMKTNCKAKLGGSLLSDGRWRLNFFNADHNHELSPSKVRFFRCNREISSRIKRQLIVNDRAGIRPNKNFNSLVVEVGGHENLSFLEKDCRNHIEKARRLRLGEGDASAIQNYFSKMQAQNTDFFFSIDLDEKGRLKNVFWADSRSRAAYKEFGDVITFDTTYLTNKYDMPFAPFVGVNHHGQSTLLGCGLISNEDTHTFTWLFRTWLACMSGLAPSGIITDQDQAMKKAIKIVFPNASHRWCLWHILKKLPEKLGTYKEYESISFALLDVVYDSQSRTEFEESWRMMINRYELHANDWLFGLYDERHRWVPIFVKDRFWAGMSTTQRSESMNEFFDGYVNSKTTLKQFVEQYDNALRSKVEKESQADFESFCKQVPCVTHFAMEVQAQTLYTMSKFKEFQMELTGKMYCEITSDKEGCMEGFIISEYDVREDVIIGKGIKRKLFKVSFHKDECEVKCSCLMLEFRGILCRHAIAVLIRNDVHLLPEKYIIRRWRKDVRRCHTRVKINNSGWSNTTEQLRYDKMCTGLIKVADLAAEDDESYSSVMDWIHNMTRELSSKKETCGSNQQTPSSIVHISSGNDITSTTKESQNILDPLTTRGKGRPPTKRKQSSKKETCASNQQTPNSIVHISSGNDITSTTKESQNVLDPLATRSKGRPPTKRKQSTIFKKQRKKKAKVDTHGSLKDSHTSAPSAYEVVLTQENIALTGSFYGQENAMPTSSKEPIVGTIGTQESLNLMGQSTYLPGDNFMVAYDASNQSHSINNVESEMWMGGGNFLNLFGSMSQGGQSSYGGGGGYYIPRLMPNQSSYGGGGYYLSGGMSNQSSEK